MTELQISENGYICYCNECISYKFANDIRIDLGYGENHLVYISISIMNKKYRINEKGIYLLDDRFDMVNIAEDVITSYAHLSPNSAKIWHKNGRIMADITYNNQRMISYAIYHENGDIIKILD